MGKNWAVAIGINHYYNLQSLEYAKRDAEAMQNWFQIEAGFDQVFLFTEDSQPIPASPQPIPTQPSFANFYGFLEKQFERPLLKPEDNLWFFFAGHGRRYRDQDYLMFLDSAPTAVDRTEYRKQTTPVGQFPPNAFGLYDMHGNVWEWCKDHWHDNYNGAPKDGSAWVENNENDNRSRVLRGGCWYGNPVICRSADRNRNYPDNNNDFIGLRIVYVEAPKNLF